MDEPRGKFLKLGRVGAVEKLLSQHPGLAPVAQPVVAAAGVEESLSGFRAAGIRLQNTLELLKGLTGHAKFEQASSQPEMRVSSQRLLRILVASHLRRGKINGYEYAAAIGGDPCRYGS
jgi:hypothetical protein